MTPTWQSDDGRVALYCADCLEVLPGLKPGSIDCVCMDPPYCSGGYLQAQIGQAKGQGHRSERLRTGAVEWFAGDNLGTAGLMFLLRTVLVECRGLLAPKRSALVFADWRMVPLLAPCLESSGLRYRNQVIWTKGSPGLGNGFKPTYECVLEFCNGSTEYASSAGRNVIDCSRVPSCEREHPCEKPATLIVELLSVVAGVDAMVCDPFMGSATVGIACIRTGRRFVGIEIDPDKFNDARARIERELSQPRLPMAEAEPAAQQLQLIEATA